MNARILLVEDNATNRYLATYLLEQRGFIVSHAADGEEALTRAADERPDLILMDIQMPKMDGYEAARRIKERADLHQIPLVALTSYAMAGDHARAKAAGFAGYIEKPIAPETFAAEVEKLLPAGGGNLPTDNSRFSPTLPPHTVASTRALPRHENPERR